MGITNIHILMNPTPAQTQEAQVRAAQEHLIAEHRRGKHPWGEMRRACPLCQQGK